VSLEGWVSVIALVLAISGALVAGWALNRDIRRRQDKRRPKR